METHKTNVMRVLDAQDIAYATASYEVDDSNFDGNLVARKIGLDPDSVFKTLVCVGDKGSHIVCCIPVTQELDLKKAAAAVGEKAIEMLKSKDLLGLTGYVHGGCSPVGMKKQFKTFIHETAAGYEKIFVSAGKVGMQMELSSKDLIAAVGMMLADIC